jgi:hypothetical protein
MDWVKLDSDGYCVGSYPDGDWDSESRPTGCIAVSDEQLAHLLKTRGRLVDDQMLPPLPVNISALKKQKLHEINAGFKSFVDSIIAQYPDYEQKTWPYQLAEAQALTADPEADAPRLLRIAQAEGVSVEQKAADVLAKAAAYDFVFDAIGHRHKLTDLVDDAATAQDLGAIAWTLTLPE